MSKAYTIFQGLVIIIVGISVLDFGMAIGGLDLSASTDPGLGFNDLLFGDDGSEFWNAISFWGYGFIVVGLLQILKGFSED